MCGETQLLKKGCNYRKDFLSGYCSPKDSSCAFFFPVMDLKVDRNMLGTTEMHHYIKAWEKEI